MRPVKLTLTAFGPFAATQTIDFREPLASRLFGIYGPTGAGKTSILDGVCFALFGESSGQERQGDDLRSHHATPDVETEARLVFEVGAKRYHVIRRPRQTVRGKRGDALVERQHWAALYDATDLDVDDISADNPGVVMEERKVEVVADRMRSILNYSAAQFRQVVLLPQGQFRQLLTASSDQRSAVLRGLFDVSLYERLVERLKGDASDLREEVERGRAAINGHLQVHDVAHAEALAELIESSKVEVLEQTSSRDTARAARDAARLALQNTQQVADRFVEYDAAEAALRDVLSRADEIDGVRARKSAADRALGCAVADSRAAEAEAELKAGLEVQAEAETQASELERAGDVAAAALRESTARQPERDAAVAKVIQLDGLKTRVLGAEPLRLAAQKSQAAVVAAKHNLDEAAKSHAAAELALTIATEGQEAAQRRALRISELDGALQALKQEEEEATSHAAATSAVQTLAAARSETQVALEALRSTLTQARQREDSAERSLSSAQAAHLARGLEDGHPCPVCGALDHPNPAGRAEGGEGLDAAWRQARAAREAADAEERSGAQAAARADGEWTQAVARLEGLLAPQRDLEEIHSAIDLAAGELASLRAGSDLQAAQAARRAAQDRAGATLAALTAARDLHADADKAATADASALQASLADVPIELRNSEAVAAQLNAMIARRDQLESVHRSAVEAERRASEALQAAVANLSHAQARTKELTEARDDHLAAFTAAKLAAGLTDDAYVQARGDVAQLDVLNSQITEHVAALAAARDRGERAASAVDGLDRPDLEAARTGLAQADASLAKAQESLTTTTIRLERLNGTRALVMKLADELATATERYRVVGELAQLTDGRNAHRLRLRDFAIAATFDLVLEAANQRFARMSRGRFALLRKFEGGDGRAKAGLDIEVYDAHTDQKRDAHTLSGGEGFLASLSLALGLSDVVQAEAGGVKLDAIFIDEGFGHLDDETLDVALDTLRDLVGQDRAVGVISHVEAVKEQIPMGFDVVRQPEGSIVSNRLGV